MSTNLQLDIAGRVATLTLIPALPGRPPTISQPFLWDLEKAIEALESTPDLAIVLIQSAVDRYFCVGADASALEQLNVDNIESWILLGHRILNRLEDLPVPVVAWVDGYALGGGLELAMACDFIWSGPDSKFGLPESKLGFVTGWGGHWRLSQRIGVTRAKSLIFSGKIVGADEALEMGLIESVFRRTDLPDRRDALKKELGSGSRISLCGHKRMLNAQVAHGRLGALEAEIAASKACLVSTDTQERVAAFLAKKTPRV